MLDFGFSEILLTSAIALVVLGPERLPKVARQVGNWMGRARVMARQLSEQLEREVNAEELLREQAKLKNIIEQPAQPASHPVPSPTIAPPLAAAPPTTAPLDMAPPLDTEVTPPNAAPPPTIAPTTTIAPPPIPERYRDPSTTTAAAMHPVTPAPTAIDPKQPAQ